ncbi:MAG: hypothetical protein Q9217_004869 [Psora testacea]
MAWFYAKQYYCFNPFITSNNNIFRVGKANPPSSAIVDFWAKWANVFEAAKPTVKPIEIVWTASTANSKNATGERKPTPQGIDLSKKDVEALRKSHALVLEHPDFKTVEAQASRLYNGVGIVTVAGGALLGPAILSVRMLRKTKSTLPVQVYLQSKEYEAEICEEVLPALDAECYIIQDFLRKDAPFEVERYQLKPLAMIFSSFEAIVWMDADCIALHDPAELLASQPYASTGLITWPDYWIATEDRVFYTIAGLSSYPKGMPARSTESGQLLVDKSKHLSTLLLAAYYNIHGPAYYYQLLGQGAPGEGDKETFLAAAVVLGQSYYRVKHDVEALGFREERIGEFYGKAMVQYHPDDDYTTKNGAEAGDVRPSFLHANVAKMNVGHLLYDDGVLYMPGTRKPIRIWGSAESNVEKFGYDVEKVVWQEMVSLACDLQHVLEDWKKRKGLCKKAREHYAAVFDANATFNPP